MQNKFKVAVATISLIVGVVFFTLAALNGFYLRAWGDVSCGFLKCVTMTWLSYACLVAVVSSYVSFLRKRGKASFVILVMALILVMLYFIIFRPELLIVLLIRVLTLNFN